MSSKSNVLKVLEQNRGKSISGQELASTLNISRAAIWKSIQELKKEGYSIDAVTNKGYSLSSESDVLSSQGIAPYLNDKEMADKIIVHKTLPSTSQTAKMLALDGAEHGTVILSECQTLGRGRLGRSFFSPANTGIYMSIILRPKLAVTNSVLITTAVSVAICNAIETITGIHAQIKWVNDIFVNNKKVCGILTEAVTDFESGNVEFIVIGIGLNFNTTISDFPTEIQDIAGSLYDEKPNGISRNQLIAEIINQVFDVCNDLEEKKYLNEYKKRSLIVGKEIEVIHLNNNLNKKSFAVAIDIDDNGCLIVKNQDGSLSTLSSGEVQIRSKEFEK